MYRESRERDASIQAEQESKSYKLKEELLGSMQEDERTEKEIRQKKGVVSIQEWVSRPFVVVSLASCMEHKAFADDGLYSR